MGQLGKRMYENHREELFGLINEQTRVREIRIAKNSGWYNKLGEKLGWGDLSNKDFLRIFSGLDANELFIVLSETDSYWNFVKFTKIHGYDDTKMVTDPRVHAPGIDYVAEHAMYVIVRNDMYQVDRYNNSKEKTVEWRGLKFKVINLQAVKNLMTKGVVG